MARASGRQVARAALTAQSSSSEAELRFLRARTAEDLPWILRAGTTSKSLERTAEVVWCFDAFAAERWGKFQLPLVETSHLCLRL